LTDQPTAAEIARIPLFAGLAPADQQRVASACRILRFEAGEVIVNEKEFAFDAYAIARGAVEVVRDGERLAVLATGAVFGELGVVPGDGRAWTRRRNASVIATEPTEAIVIDGRTLRRLTEEIAVLREAVEATAAQRR